MSANLKSLIESSKCRKGDASGRTKDGAYWLAARVKIRRFGGDGIGQSATDCEHYLELRHYRDGAVRAKLVGSYYHQNGSPPDRVVSADAVLDCTTVEGVIVALKGMRVGGDHAYSDHSEVVLSEALSGLGLPPADPPPDGAE